MPMCLASKSYGLICDIRMLLKGLCLSYIESYNKRFILVYNKIMNRFVLFPCVVQKEETSGYSGPLASLISQTNTNLVLFFPISEENASIINYSLNEENRKKINVNQDVIGVYKTMIESWKAGDRHISGVILDAKYDNDAKEHIIDASIIIINSDGNLDNVVKTNFVHAMVVVAIEDMEVYITDYLFNKLKPQENIEENDEEDDEDKDGPSKPPSPVTPELPKQEFPIDQKIITIARQIMNGKVEDK